ncbi:DUF3617 domain-containing protein [Neisseria sp. Ec49-e6-T10]|uniref:DUF3617 domain-containing protein n=1 Tax=Neisseria sp. Ec49-e6-T10 TaxID=3140744 RepID=UPI003EB6E224
MNKKRMVFAALFASSSLFAAPFELMPGQWQAQTVVQTSDSTGKMSEKVEDYQVNCVTKKEAKGFFSDLYGLFDSFNETQIANVKEQCNTESNDTDTQLKRTITCKIEGTNKPYIATAVVNSEHNQHYYVGKIESDHPVLGKMSMQSSIRYLGSCNVTK